VSSSPRDLADGKLRLDFPAEHLARLTIDHPAKRNALDHALLDAIAETVPTLDARCLLVTAVGPVFSAGYDIGNLPKEELAEKAEKLVAHPFHDAIEALDAFEFPVVAALNGHTIGGGLELALTADLRVAADSAKLGMPPAKLGLVYSHTGLRKFIDTIGVARTRELFYTGRNIAAEDARAWGLVNEVVPVEEVEARGIALAGEIAANAPLSLQGNKRIIRELLRAEFRMDEALERELVELRESCFTTDDFFEGIRAFGEKRKPVWRGT
jgi:enoyl-CoA hydratase/carnithine racemase